MLPRSRVLAKALQESRGGTSRRGSFPDPVLREIGGVEAKSQRAHDDMSWLGRKRTVLRRTRQRCRRTPEPFGSHRGGTGTRVSACLIFASAPAEAVSASVSPQSPPESLPCVEARRAGSHHFIREVDAKAWWGCVLLRWIPLPPYGRLYTRPVRSVTR